MVIPAAPPCSPPTPGAGPLPVPYARCCPQPAHTPASPFLHRRKGVRRSSPLSPSWRKGRISPGGGGYIPCCCPSRTSLLTRRAPCTSSALRLRLATRSLFAGRCPPLRAEPATLSRLWMFSENPTLLPREEDVSSAPGFVSMCGGARHSPWVRGHFPLSSDFPRCPPSARRAS